MTASRDFRLYLLLIVAAAARLLTQMAAMPPYAGLDEVYHVARLAFVLQERRNPTTHELSIPPYLNDSIEQRWNALPAFCVIGDQWPRAVVLSGGPIVRERTLIPNDLRPYRRANYEAQQTSIAYTIIAPVARLLPDRSSVSELRLWRSVSLLFALAVVVATATIAERFFGAAGLVAAALVVSLPTWETLVMRAGNDAFACAAAAIAIAVTLAAPRRPIGIVAEALAWAIAINAKLYVWPVAAAVPLFWRRQGASRARMAAATLAGVVAATMTLVQLSHRTGNPLGVVAFDQPGGSAVRGGLNPGEIVRVTIASAAWTSGQHWDALRPFAIALIFGPILIVIVSQRPRLAPAAAVLVAFAAAQAWNVVSCIRARAAGNPVPIGGKEGWYWYVLVPLIIPLLLTPAVARFRALVWWIVVWDIIITEGALFHDYSGASSPAHPTALFRWGPWHWPFTAHLEGIALGPFVGAIVLLRIIHLCAFFALESLTRAQAGVPAPHQ